MTSGGSYLSHDAQFLTCVCRLVYVLGGWNGACLNTVERYEPGSDLMHQPGDLLAPAEQLQVLTLLFAGVDQWVNVASMTQRRKQFGAAVLDGQIYVVGGVDDTSQYLGSVERYSAKFDSWRPVSPILVDRCVRLDCPISCFYFPLSMILSYL